MKTTSYLALLTFFILTFASHKARPAPLPAQLVPLTTMNKPQPATPAIGGWYLSKGQCPWSEYLYCCCSDGYSYMCSYPLVYFGCRPGGPFECTPDLANCQEDPSNCETCCPSGRC